MKQCSSCKALYLPRFSTCPKCATEAPQAWVRTKSRAKTREVKAVLPKAARPAHHREEFAGRKTEDAADQTLQISRDQVLAALRAEGLDLDAEVVSVDETVEGLEVEAYVFDEQDEEQDDDQETVSRAGFVQFDSLEQLSDELFFEVEHSEAGAAPVGSTSAMRQLVERSREVAHKQGAAPHTGEIEQIEVLEPVVLEPVVLEPVVLEPVVLEPVFEPVERGGEFQAWVLDEVDALLLTEPPQEQAAEELAAQQAAPEKRVAATSSVTAWLTTICLLGVAGWALAIDAPMPVVLALVVGGCVVALLSSRATSR